MHNFNYGRDVPLISDLNNNLLSGYFYEREHELERKLERLKSKS